MHNNVDHGNGLTNNVDLWELWGGSTGHLGNPDASQLVDEVLQLLLIVNQMLDLFWGLIPIKMKLSEIESEHNFQFPYNILSIRNKMEKYVFH